MLMLFYVRVHVPNAYMVAMTQITEFRVVCEILLARALYLVYT